MAQEAAVPNEDLLKKMREIAAEEVRKYARSSPLNNASITGGAGLSIKNGGKLLVEHPDGRWLMLMGSYDGPGGYLMPDGSQQPMALIWRADGTLAFGMYDPDPSNGFQQFWSLWDRKGNIVVGDDTDSGQGIARPYVPGSFYRSDYNDWVTVTGTAFATKFRARMPKQHPRLYIRAWASNDTAGATGQVRVLVNNVPWGPTQSTSYGITEYVWGPLPVDGDHISTLVVELQARMVSGSGGVRLEPIRLDGQQS